MRFKKTIAAVICAAMVMGLAGCGKEETSSAPANTSTTTSSSPQQTSSVIETSSEPEESTPEESTPAPAPADKNSLVPAFGAIMDDDLKLGTFIVNGITYDIADDIPVNKYLEDQDDKPFTKGMNKMTYAEEVGVIFYGNTTNKTGINIEATENGKLVDDWGIVSGKAPFESLENYKIKGIRAASMKDISVNGLEGFDFEARFVGGLTAGEAPEYYEELLGKGYEVECHDAEYKEDIRLSVYKNSTVTMVIEYRNKGGKNNPNNLSAGVQEDKWLCGSIILIKND